MVAFGREAVGADVRLADGSRIAIRPIDPGDAPLLLAGFAELSEKSRSRRFRHAQARARRQHLGLGMALLERLTERGEPPDDA
jgi:hypothetical protein